MIEDILVDKIVSKCLLAMRGCPSVTKMTACYNLTERILRLFVIQGSKEDVLNLVEEFHEGLKKEIEKYYEE